MQTPDTIVFHFVVQVVTILVIDIKGGSCVMHINPQGVLAAHYNMAFEMPRFLGFVRPLPCAQTCLDGLFGLRHGQLATKFHRFWINQLLQNEPVQGFAEPACLPESPRISITLFSFPFPLPVI